jgi:titin
MLVVGVVATPAWSAQPDPPQGQPDVTSGNARITVDFTPSFYGGGFPIDFYTATCTPSPSGTPASASAAAPPIVVGNVFNGTTYTCTVNTHNTNNETSVESLPSDPVTPAPQVPDPPAKPTATAGNHSAVVSFTPPANNGSTITSYTAACTSSDGGTFGSASGSGSPITVTNLTTNKTYTCTVTATNGVGESNESENSDPVVPAQVPDAPTITSVVRGNAHIDVSFTVPNDNGSAITSFSATCTSSNGGATGTNTGTTTMITVTGLTNARTYRCTARASNTFGAGPPSAPSAQVVPATVPSPPKIADADPGDSAASVNFTPQASNGATITSYSATCTSTDGGTDAGATGTHSPVLVGGLDNGRTYSCSVKAINAIGTSAASSDSPSFVVGEPVRPRIGTIVSGPAKGATGGLSISLVPGADNGSPISAYRATCRPATTGVARSATASSASLFVGGLDTGKAYVCSATATNDRGTSRESAAVRAIVGAPGPPRITRVAPLSHGLAFAFLGSAANGRPVIDYHVQCTSSNGGAGQSSRGTESPLTAANLTVGGSYTCVLTARNSRGEGAPSTVGPIVVKPPSGSGLASCSGNRGTMKIDPGMQQKAAETHVFDLAATLGPCKGPYVNSARVSFPLRTKRAASCGSVVGLVSSGAGTVFWTAPQGMGKSQATIQLKITATGDHVTKATYFGTVTSGNGIFKGAHVKGTLTLGRGFHASSTGGDCGSKTPLSSLPVTAMTLVLS